MNNEPTGSAQSTQIPVGVQVQILADSTVSYASYQNNVPLARGLTLS